MTSHRRVRQLADKIKMVLVGRMDYCCTDKMMV